MVVAAVVFGACVALVLACGVRSELAIRRRERQQQPMPEPRSLVRVLESEDELQEAVERAVDFEKEIAQSVADRIGRYREESHVAPVVALPRDVDQVRGQPSEGVRDSA